MKLLLSIIAAAFAVMVVATTYIILDADGASAASKVWMLSLTVIIAAVGYSLLIEEWLSK